MQRFDPARRGINWRCDVKGTVRLTTRFSSLMFPGKNGHAVKRPTRPLFATVRQLVIVDKRVRYEVRGTPFAEPVKPYRVWCRDRLHARSVDLDHTARADV